MNQQQLFFSSVFGSILPGDNALDCGCLSFPVAQTRGGNRRPFSFSPLGDRDGLQRGAGRAAALLPDQPVPPVLDAVFVVEALDPVEEVVHLRLLHLALGAGLAG